MSLLCNCNYYDYYNFKPGEWIYSSIPLDPEFLPLDTSRAKRCCSCRSLIKVGDLCTKYKRYRYPHTDVESRIECGCDLDDSFCDTPTIRIADHYHCEWCGEMFFNLIALGFECLVPCEKMDEALKDYHKLSGFKA